MGGILGGLAVGGLSMIFGDLVVSGFNSGAGSVFNWVMSVIYKVITANWEDLAGSSTLGIVNSVNLALQAVGVSLVTIFTLMNIVKSTTNLIELKRPAVLFRAAFRLIISDVIVVYSYDLFMWIYNVLADTVKLLLTTAGYDPSRGFPITGAAFTFQVTGLGQLLAMFFAFAVFIATVIVSFSVLLTVLGRFFKIFIYAMIAPVPLSLLACEETDRLGKRYLASFFCVCLEGLIIAAACALFITYFSTGMDGTSLNGITDMLADAFSMLGDSAESVAQQIVLLLNISIFSGMVKGSDRVVRELVG